MNISFKILSTISGKSLILQLNNEKYVFNVFEGLQRYCIEKKLSLASVSTVFLSNKMNIPPFLGMYLTIGDMKEGSINVVYTGDFDFEKTHKFAFRPTLKMNISRSFEDKNIIVKTIDIQDQCNYLLKYKHNIGKFYPEKVPELIPKTMFKALKNGETIVINNIKYHGFDYCENIYFPEIAIIFSSENLDPIFSLINSLPIFFCVNKSAVSAIINKYSNTHDSHSLKIYYLNDNSFVEYENLFELQKLKNSVDSKYLLPLKPKFQKLGLPDFVHVLESGTCLEYKREDGLLIVPDQNLMLGTETQTSYYPSILFLGTACAIPSKYRNVSGILYESCFDSILLDCGEDTLGQILRVYGNLNCLKKLKLIYLSHSHADHILGVPKILQNIDHNITILAPRECRSFIESFYRPISEHNYIETDYSKELERKCYSKYPFLNYCDLQSIPDEFFNCDISEFTLKFEFKNLKITICGCPHHLSNSASIMISDEYPNIKFSYSGDTIPSAMFCHISQNADLMIHEATFADDLVEQAALQMHSRFSEAVNLYKKSKSKNLLLTHFSNRIKLDEQREYQIFDFYRYEFKKN